MVTKYPSKLIVQPDWDTALRERDKTIWCHYRNKDVTKYMHLSLNECGDAQDGARIIKVEQQQLHVDFQSKRIIFQSPHTSYHGIHAKRRYINSLHVTDNLGVSSDAEGNMFIWHTNDGEVRRTLEGHLAEVNVCRFFPSGIVVLSGGADMQIKIWSAEDGHCAATMRGHRSAVHDLVPVERGRNIVSCSKDGTARLWDVGQSTCLREFNTPDNEPLNACILFTPDSSAPPVNDPSVREVGTEGKLLLVASESGSVFAFDLRTGGDPVASWKTGDTAVNALTLLPGPSEVAAGTAGGDLIRLDLRHPTSPSDRVSNARSGIRTLHRLMQHIYCGFGDGTVARYEVSDPSAWKINTDCFTEYELTGPDCDPITGLDSTSDWLFTSSRDGVIRKYRRHR